MAAGMHTEVQAQGAKGGIRGKIVDADFTSAVGGASVFVEEAGASGRSDSEGSFTITDLEPGTYAITISREGFLRERITGIAVPAGGFAEVTVLLEADVFELAEFVVTDEDLVDPTDISEIELQQSLVSFTGVIGEGAISELGASDAGQALLKGSGVSVVGGQDLFIRGLGDRFISVQLNGAGVPSSNPDKRSPDIDLFPGSIVRTLQTSKTFTPDLPGEASGGNVKIETMSIPDEDFFEVKIGTGYETLTTGNPDFLTSIGPGVGVFGTYRERRLPGFMENAELLETIAAGAGEDADQALRDRINSTLTPVMGTSRRAPDPDFALEASYGKRFTFFGKPAGLLLGLDYRKKHNYDPDGIEKRYEFGVDGTPLVASRSTSVQAGEQTMRGSLIAVLGVEPKPGDEVKMTFFTNRTAEDRASFRLSAEAIPPFAEPTPSDDYNLREALVYTERQLTAIQLTGRHGIDSEKAADASVLEWYGSYNESYQLEPDHRFTVADTVFDLSSFTPPPVSPIPDFRRYWRELRDERWNLGASLDHSLHADDEKEMRVKLGGGFDSTRRDYRADNFAYNESGLNNLIGFPSFLKPSPYPGATWADVWNFSNPTNLSLPDGFADFGHYLFRFGGDEFYEAQQHIPHGFLMFDADVSDRLNLVFGLRAEQTNIAIEASDIFNVEEQILAIALLPPELRTPQNINDLNDPVAAAANADIRSARFANLHETHVLPALTMRYDLSENVALRAAFSRTIARPTFKELAPVVIRDAETGDFFIGNSQLETADVTNYDMRLEWYPQAGGQLALSGFAKDIQRPIEKISVGDLEQFDNSEKGTIYGFEIEADRDLGFLSEALRGVGVGGNYSFIRSVAEREVIGSFGRTRRLQGQPDYLLNFNLSYEHPLTGIFSALYLNMTGAYIDAVGGANQPDILALPRTTLNAVVKIPVGENGEFSLRANNLTSEGLTRIYDGPGSPIYSETSVGIAYSVSYTHYW